MYYAPEDLAGLGARFAIGAIDGAVLLFMIVVFYFVFEVVGVDVPLRRGYLLPFFVGYLGGIKGTRLGTLGYRLMGYRLVGLDGRPPSVTRSMARSVFTLFWFGLDTFWVKNDENKQAFRDKLAGTYVVRRGAEPLGAGRLSYSEYFVAGGSVRVAEVQRS